MFNILMKYFFHFIMDFAVKWPFFYWDRNNITLLFILFPKTKPLVPCGKSIIYIFRGIWSFLSLLLQFKQIKSSGIEDRFMNAANLLLNWINIIQLPLRLVITKCTYDKHIEGDGGFWDLSQISDYKLKRFWDLGLYMYMMFFIIFTSTQSNKKFRYRRWIHESSKSPPLRNQYNSTSSMACYHQMNLWEAHRRRWRVFRPESNLWLEIKKVLRPESYGPKLKTLKIKLWEEHRRRWKFFRPESNLWLEIE